MSERATGSTKANGANSVHKQLRTGLEDYIKSQYFGKSPLLLAALNQHIDDEGLLYQKPFIESSPSYVTVPNGIEKAALEDWMKAYFLQLAQAGTGVFTSPFAHQIAALEAAVCGEDLFVDVAASGQDGDGGKKLKGFVGSTWCSHYYHVPYERLSFRSDQSLKKDDRRSSQEICSDLSRYLRCSSASPTVWNVHR